MLPVIKNYLFYDNLDETYFNYLYHYLDKTLIIIIITLIKKKQYYLNLEIFFVIWDQQRLFYLVSNSCNIFAKMVKITCRKYKKH